MSVMDAAADWSLPPGYPVLAARCQCYPLAPAMSNGAGHDNAACLPIGEGRPMRHGALGADPALDEGCFVTAPFGRAEELAVGVDSLPPVVQALQVRKAHAAVHLGRQPSYLAADIIKMRFGLQGCNPRLVRQRVLSVGRKPNERAAGLEGGREIGQRVFDTLERAD